MAIKYHKAATDDGGAIGDEILSGIAGALFPKVKINLDDTLIGETIYRKFYLSNSGLEDEPVIFSLEEFSIFTTILFESSGDSQVVGDLAGSETDESPIHVTIPAGGHKSFWLKVIVPDGITTAEQYSTTRTRYKK